VRTPFIAELIDQPALVAKFEQLTPLGRLAKLMTLQVRLSFWRAKHPQL
jgi:hypothetical protein